MEGCTPIKKRGVKCFPGHSPGLCGTESRILGKRGRIHGPRDASRFRSRMLRWLMAIREAAPRGQGTRMGTSDGNKWQEPRPRRRESVG